MGGDTDDFDELLECIRDIHASERRLYRKIIDINDIGAIHDNHCFTSSMVTSRRSQPPADSSV